MLAEEKDRESATPVRVADVKPLLRGIPDVLATIASVPAVALLIARSAPGTARLSAAVYGASVILLFAVSATYHTPDWPMNIRHIWRRCDHATIYFLIAGSYTPMCLIGMEPSVGQMILGIVWGAAILGLLKSFFWPKAPRWLNAAVYIGIGWTAIFVAPSLLQSLGPIGFGLVFGGGLFYTVGAVLYVWRWPNPYPSTFGYHEIFHLFVTAAGACHYAAMWRLLT
ncbi:MAG: hemolysin III family protein [Myxococcota bacterium]